MARDPQTEYDVYTAAKIMGIPRGTLYRWIGDILDGVGCRVRLRREDIRTDNTGHYLLRKTAVDQLAEKKHSAC